MSLDWISEFLVNGFAWKIFDDLILSFVLSSILTLIGRKALNKLEIERQLIWFFSATSAFIFIVLTLTSLSTYDRFQLKGQIMQDAFGGTIDTPEGPKPSNYASLAVGITNIGQYPSVITGMNVTVSIDGQNYDGKLQQMPKTVSLRQSDGTELKYFEDDSLISKVATPIQVGGMLTGVVIVNFPDLPPDTINRGKPYFSFRFSDVADHHYLVTSGGGRPLNGFLFIPGLTHDVH